MLNPAWLETLIASFSPQPARSGGRAAKHRGMKARRLKLESLENRQLMAFDTAVIYAGITGPRDIDTGDFTGDGYSDLVTANAGNSLGLLLNRGDGTFQAGPNLPLDSPGMGVVVGDLNSDGHLDLTATLSGTRITGYAYGYYGERYPITVNVGTLKSFLGDGAGNFSAGAPQDLGDGRFFSLALGDLDSDGNLDLAATNWDGGEISVLLGNGDGTFAAPERLGVGAAPQGIDIADLDDDGALDLVTTNLYGDVKVLLGVGDGSFQAPLAVSPGGPNAQGQAVGDVNDDGKFDLVVTTFRAYGGCYYSCYTSYDSVGVNVLLGNGDGTFAPGNLYLADNSPLEPVELADFDGDGKLDIAAASYASGNVNLLLGRGDGTFGAAAAYSTGGGGGGPADIVVADFNSDATLDIATANYGYSAVAVLFEGDSPPVPPSIGISDTSVTEGNSGTRPASFAVTLSAPSAQPVTVAYSTSDGTAAATSDYRATNGVLTFAAGETSKSIEVQVKGDRAAESDETFVVQLSGAAGATIATGQAVGTIVDDEPQISISDVTKREGDSSTTRFVFTVSLSAAADERVTVEYATANGTAKKGDSDYVASSGKVTFRPGEISKTITVTVKGDKKVEAHETFFVNLSHAKGAVVDDGQGVGTITNDDRGRRGSRWYDWLASTWDINAAIEDFLDFAKKKRS